MVIKFNKTKNYFEIGYYTNSHWRLIKFGFKSAQSAIEFIKRHKIADKIWHQY